MFLAACSRRLATAARAWGRPVPKRATFRFAGIALESGSHSPAGLSRSLSEIDFVVRRINNLARFKCL